jgi:ParB family transcriptional regulator, chromosome partitioning protein
MARKNPFAGLRDGPEGPVGAPALEYAMKGPSRSILSSFDEMSARANAASEIEALLAAGDTVVEIDPAQIDPSFAKDRMRSFEPEGADANFVAAIKEQGQLVPVLLRSHPTASGRYQPAYGRRRIAAAAHLGRKVRALVRELDDEQLVVAQGQENESRNALTFIEKCRFAQTLETHNFSRKVIESALSVQKTNLSVMLQVVEAIPGEIVDWIGPAPEIGRPRWLALASLLRDERSLKRVKAAFSREKLSADNRDSAKRFAIIFDVANAKSALSKPLPWTRPDLRKPYGALTISSRKITLTIDRSANSALAAMILEKLDEMRRQLDAAEIPVITNKEH